MRTDTNPSVIFGLYSKPEKKQELFKELKKLGVAVREFSLIDVEIPLNEDYDKIINFFKHFVKCDYWASRNLLLKKGILINQLKEQLAKYTGYKPIVFKRDSWKPDNKHKLLWTLAVPLLYQDQTDALSLIHI